MADSYARPGCGRDAEGPYITINLGGDLMRFRVTEGVFSVFKVQVNHVAAPATRNNASPNVVYLDSEPEEREGHHDR